MRALIIHGWASSPEDCWFPWLRSELEARQWDVTTPPMPHPMAPEIAPWVETTLAAIGEPGDDLVLVGHSLGCQAILRALERVRAPVAGAVLVAGFLHPVTGLRSEKEKQLVQVWETTPIDAVLVRAHCPQIQLFLSDDDQYITLENGPRFERELGAIVTIVPRAGHFARSDGCTELPTVLDAVLGFAAQRVNKSSGTG